MWTKCLYAETLLLASINLGWHKVTNNISLQELNMLRWINSLNLIQFPLSHCCPFLQRRHNCNLQNGMVEAGWVKPGQLVANGAARIISNNRCEALLGEIQQAFYFLVEGKLGNEAILK